MTSPNPRLQRTRWRAPLSRKPLGGLVAITLALIAPACRNEAAADPPNPDRVLTPSPYRAAVVKGYEGHIELAFERAAFVPCGSTEAWWLGEPEDPSIRSRLTALQAGARQGSNGTGVRLFFRGHGRVAGPGH